MARAKARPVRAVETGEVFGSVAEAAASVGCQRKSMYDAIRRGRPLKGFHWSYAEAGDGGEGAGDAPESPQPEKEAFERPPVPTPDVISSLLSQLEAREGQIDRLRERVTVLKSQLADKERQVDRLTSVVKELSETERLRKSTESYWQKKADEYELALRKEQARSKRLPSETETGAKPPSALEKLKRLFG